jgi:ribosomal protein S16
VFCQYWLSVGAQASDTVKRILGNAGILPEYVHPLAVQSAVPRKDRPKKIRKKKKSKKE